MSDIKCSTCGATIALADAEESVVSAAVKNHDRFCRAPGWGDAPLRSLPTSNGRGSKMRRDLTELDGDFLATQLADAWQGYLATYHARNASIGRAIFDADDVESELRLLLTEAATRFDHLKGTGNFAAWACDRQRTMLLDVSRKQHPDARIAAAAKKVMDAIDRLDAVWAENAAKAELRAERDRLKAQLKKVEAQLRGGATPAPARDWKAIREWAADSGLDCPATGKVPNAIVDAYDQAHA